jgi:hypothetical protein
MLGNGLGLMLLDEVVWPIATYTAINHVALTYNQNIFLFGRLVSMDSGTAAAKASARASSVNSMAELEAMYDIMLYGDQARPGTKLQ